jgi:hypothetical protein
MRRLREDLLREESGTNSVDFFESFVMLKDSDIQPNSWNEVRWTGYQNNGDALSSRGPFTTTIQITPLDEGSVAFLNKSTIDIDIDLTIDYTIQWGREVPPEGTNVVLAVVPKSAASLISDIQLKVGNNAIFTVPYNRVHQMIIAQGLPKEFVESTQQYFDRHSADQLNFQGWLFNLAKPKAASQAQEAAQGGTAMSGVHGGPRTLQDL